VLIPLFNLNIYIYIHIYLIFIYIQKKNFFFYFSFLLKIKKLFSSIKLKYRIDCFALKSNFYFFNFFKKIFKNNKFFFFQKNKKIKLLDFNKLCSSYILKNRKIFRFFFFDKKKKSKKLNKTILNLKKNNNVNFFYKIIFRIDYILSSNHFIYSKIDSNMFLKKKFFFLNRLPVKNLGKILYKNDVIELIFSKFYFFYLLKLKNILYLKNFFLIKFKKKWIDLNKIKKKNSFLSENKFFKYFFSKVLEINFFCLSIFLLKNFIDFLFLEWKIKKFLIFFFFSLYNWKYLN